MSDLVKKYAALPTIMDYEDEMAAIKDLIAVGATTLVQDKEGLIFILSKIEESYQHNGVFEYKITDCVIFRQFVNLLQDINLLEPEMGINMDNVIYTFSHPGFDSGGLIKILDTN